jgi:hypothetical protein
MASIFGIGDHSHDTNTERAHLTNGLIVAFGLALLAFFVWGFGTHQLTIEGSIKADNLWMLFVTVLSGLFGWVMRGKQGERGAADSAATTGNAPPAAPAAPQGSTVQSTTGKIGG